MEGQMAWDAQKRAIEFGDAHLADALSAVRDEALEEAAKIVEDRATSTAANALPFRRGLAVAAEIRARKRKEPKVCPLCPHEFQGNGWDGIDAHWKAKHLDVMSYNDAWPLIQKQDFESIRKAASGRP
jgi:hypothetical protein